MNKKITIIIGVVILVGIVITAFFLSGGFTKISEEDGSTIIEENKVITDTVTYINEDIIYKITRNKVTKNATIEMDYPIPDDVESFDFLGSQVTMIPFTVNFSCATLNAAFFDPEAYQNMVAVFNDNTEETEPVTENSEFAEKLEDYTITEFQINFNDQEDKGKIAMCQSENANINEMKFEVYRDYSELGSFLSTEIGIFEESESGN